jgi:DNA-binding NarL/FixJ family response regulator
VLKVAMADDHPLMLAGVRRMLESDGGFEIVGEAHDGTGVLPMVGRTNPDVLLLDMRMPGIDGLGCLARVRERYPNVKVIVCSMGSDPEQIEAAFKRGACGYIVKSVDTRDLAAAIRQAVHGTAYHASGLPAITGETIAKQAGLTDREVEMMKAVAGGLSNKAIAQRFWITEQTVKFHLTNIYRKIGVSNRTEAAAWALSKGLSDDDREEVASSA